VVVFGAGDEGLDHGRHCCYLDEFDVCSGRSVGCRTWIDVVGSMLRLLIELLCCAVLCCAVLAVMLLPNSSPLTLYIHPNLLPHMTPLYHIFNTRATMTPFELARKPIY
jgi:hypothetical protein